VSNPYDRIVGEFAEARAGFRERGYVDRLIALAVPGSRILDLGCGTGVPIARYLIDHGFRVTGVDSSAAMLALAKRHCPGAELILMDMTELELDGPFGSDHPSESRRLEACGVDVLTAEVDDPSSRGHVAILCTKAG
jgi:SAM-dependent methyltransferase